MNAISVRTALLRKPGLIAATAAASALVALGVPLAIAAPTASPPSDGQGYVDSTARCTKPDTAVIFGTTDTSRVAVCKTAGGAYEYRGVRVRDGAKLIASATPVSADSFQADSDGATYNVSPTGLSITVGGSTVRTESWNDFHNPQSPAAGTGASGTATTSGKPTTSGAKPSTATSGTATSGTATSGTAASGTTASGAASAAPTSAAAPISAPPLPPPLPAEVGGAPAPKR